MNKKLSSLLLIFIIFPQIAFASWWDPSSWSVWNIFHHSKSEVQQITTGSTTPAKSASTTIQNKQSSSGLTTGNKKSIKYVKRQSDFMDPITNQKSSLTIDNPTSNTPSNSTLCNGTYWTACPTGQEFVCPSNGGKAYCQFLQQANNMTISKDDQKLINAGVTPQEIEKMKRNELDPVQFMGMMNRIKDKYKRDNPYLIQKNILLDYIYQTLSGDEMSKLSPDIQHVVQSGNRDAIDLQIQILNDQILNYNFNIDKEIQILINSYLSQQGLPVTQPVPTRTNCTTYTGGLNPTINCYTQ